MPSYIKNMNAILLGLFSVLFVLGFIIHIDSTFAFSCERDNDWPKTPCYDSPPYPDLQKKISDFSGYYEYKGSNWMEMKKIEMNEVIKSGTLKKWIEGGTIENEFGPSNPNKNVWHYYYLNGEAPYYQGANKDLQPVSPLQQVKSGKPLANILCKPGLELIFRNNNGLPVCIKPSSFSHLIKIGFTNPPAIIPDNTKIVQISCETSPLTIDELVKKSKYVLVGKISGINTISPTFDSTHNQTLIYTDFFITVEKDLLEGFSGDSINIRTIGGESQNLLVISNCDAKFSVDEQVILFIDGKQSEHEYDIYNIIGRKVGTYKISDNKVFGNNYPDGIDIGEFISKIHPN